MINHDIFAALVGLALSSDDVDDRVAAVTALADAYRRSGQIAASDDALAAGIAHLQRLDAEADDLGSGGLTLGRYAKRHERPALARAALEFAAERFEAAEERLALGVTWHDIAETWSPESDGERIVEAYRRAAELKTPYSDDVDDLLLTIRRLADAEHRWGTPAGCAAALERGLGRLEREGGDRAKMAAKAHALGRLGERCEQPAAARAAYTFAAARLDEVGDRRGRAITLADIGDTWEAENEHAEALEAYRAALEIATPEISTQWRLDRLLQLAEAEHSVGDKARRDVALDQALELLADADLDRAKAGRDAHRLGELAVKAGRHALARSAFHRAAESKRQGGDVRSLLVTLTWAARLENACGDLAGCATLLSEALERLERWPRADAEKADDAKAIAEIAGQVGDQSAAERASLLRERYMHAPPPDRGRCWCGSGIRFEACHGRSAAS